MLVDSPSKKDGELETGEEGGSADLGVRGRGRAMLETFGEWVRFEDGRWVCIFGRSDGVLLRSPRKE